MLSIYRLRQSSSASLKKRLATSLLAASAALLSASTLAADAPLPYSEQLLEQRALYLEARSALAQGDRAAAQRLRSRLDDYPLNIYLDYELLRPQLTSLARTGNDGEATDGRFHEIDQFLEAHSDSYLGNRLEREWVSALANENQNIHLSRYHNPDNTNTTLTCRALRAELALGNDKVLEDVDRLWNVAVSQPNDCDPVFEAWITAGYLTPDIAWQRFSKTLQAGHNNLARYVSTLMPQREQDLAQLYLRIDREPERLRNLESLSARTPEVKEIILHGVRRLMTIDAPTAMMLLESHNDVHDFDDDTLLEHRRLISFRLLLQGFVSETESLLRNTPGLATEPLVSYILRDALRDQDWQRVSYWLEHLPEDAQQTERWRYWRARALAQQNTDAAREQALELHRSLAETRSFYGFLSADLLGVGYELVDTPVTVADTQLLALYNDPSIMRAFELYHIGDEPGARNEWQYAVRRMPSDQVAAAGKLADSWGWHRNSIQAMIQIGHWDDMQLRFPLAYSDQFASAARELGVSPQLLFAIARQESAFMHDVRSPAGARGLMQLMPGTAQDTARSAGLQVRTADLYQPDINITLGSRYLAGLLQEFDGNRALAAAAYNAGPNRVRQWLRRSADNPVPLDIWIETIPFFETRGYVQNVLAYAVIYGYRMGEPVPFLNASEAAATL